MSLTPGTRLGPYEVTAQIGVGGMGEVYRAIDTNLKRAVALKVLPQSVADDADRIGRFQREAEVLASLNHPNIAHVHGLERADGVQALVMELVEGPTLADRIAQGPIAFDEALSIAQQIAEALEVAHEQGIIHRDLKPANIKVRTDGTVKVLDFGLAKAMEPAGVTSPSVSQSPTITSPAMTRMGVILGTAAYMSPEQARGQAVDKRTDIWAFGCVLYEMLAGCSAFAAGTVPDTLAAVLTLEPDWARLHQDVPVSMRRLIQRCLVKDARSRLGEISTARFVIEELITTGDALPTSSAHLAPVPQAGVWKKALAFVVGSIVTGVIVAAFLNPDLSGRARVAPLRTDRFTLETAGRGAFRLEGAQRNVAVTPDGSAVVYVGTDGVFVRAFDQLEPRRIVTSGGSLGGLFLSRDGSRVGFVESTIRLKTAPIGGGPATALAEIDGYARGATWVSNASIVFATASGSTGLQRVADSGGEVTILTRPDAAKGELDHVWPEALPDGRAVLFTVTPSLATDVAQVAVLDLESGEQTTLIRGGSHAHYVPTGHLIFLANDALRAVAFDAARRVVLGTPTPLPIQPSTMPSGGGAFIAANDATLVYSISGGSDATAMRTLAWVDRRGHEEPLPTPARAYLHPRVSPDGTRVAVTIQAADGEVWVWDIARETLQRVASELPLTSPNWMPDGTRLVAASGRAGNFNLYSVHADGTAGAERLTDSPNAQVPTGLTPNGSHVLFWERMPDGRRDLKSVMPVGRQVQTLLQGAYSHRNGVVSSDGTWMAYEADSAGPERLEIYVRPFPAVERGQWLVSAGGGTRPVWAPNGRELFYIAPDGALMVVSVDPHGGTWRANRPERLLAPGYYTLAGGDFSRSYDVSRDGQRFLMVKSADESRATDARIVVVRNWFEELKRLVPTK